MKKTVRFISAALMAALSISCEKDKAYDGPADENNIDYTGLVLNELNGNDKFIELYNGASEAIDITGIQINKDDNGIVWTAPSRTIKAGEYLLLYSEDVVIAGEAQEGYDKTLVFGSGLSSKKAVHITLFKPDGSTVVDDFNLVNHPTPGEKIKGSYGRNKDGKWYIQPEATPGKANVDGTEALKLGE